MKYSLVASYAIIAAVTLFQPPPACAGVDDVYQATCRGDLSAAQKELDAGTPLEPRAVKCAIDAVAPGAAGQFIVQNGFDINAPLDKFGLTSLHWALNRRDLTLPLFLLQNGADPNALSTMGPPLHFLLNSEALTDRDRSLRLEAVRALIEHGADPSLEAIYANPIDPTETTTPLALAASNSRGSPAIIQYLIEKGADPNQPAGHARRSPLFFAVTSGSSPSPKIELLLNNGADPYARDRDGNFSFTWARMDADAIRTLIRLGVDLTLSGQASQNATLFAGCSAGIESLAEIGAPFDAVRASDGAGVLHHLLKVCNLGMPEDQARFRLAISGGADISLPNSKGLTPMMEGFAAQGTIAPVILLELGADPNRRDPQGQTALHYFVSGAHERTNLNATLEALQSSNADFNAADINGTTPLMAVATRAVRGASIEAALVRALVVRGADLRRTNSSGQTACDLAVQPDALNALQTLGGCR